MFKFDDGDGKKDKGRRMKERRARWIKLCERMEREEKMALCGRRNETGQRDRKDRGYRDAGDSLNGCVFQKEKDEGKRRVDKYR